MSQDEDDGGEDQLQQQDEDTAEESDVAIAIKLFHGIVCRDVR